jgi:hypothetical protein
MKLVGNIGFGLSTSVRIRAVLYGICPRPAVIVLGPTVAKSGTLKDAVSEQKCLWEIELNL